MVFKMIDVAMQIHTKMYEVKSRMLTHDSRIQHQVWLDISRYH
jgi:hypothetical protein